MGGGEVAKATHRAALQRRRRARRCAAMPRQSRALSCKAKATRCSAQRSNAKDSHRQAKSRGAKQRYRAARLGDATRRKGTAKPSSAPRRVSVFDRRALFQKMNILVACEFSGIVRDAFRARGHDAWSCDLIECEGDPRWHICGDALEAIRSRSWDLAICHPPCTHLSVSGARWFPSKRADGSQQAAIDFFMACINAPVPRVAVENPVCIMSRLYRRPDQIIQPWQFGHPETKAICLWLKNLPKLEPTQIVSGREARVHRMPPGPDRWKARSRTLQGIAKAMAESWG